MYWAQALAKQTEDSTLQSRFAPLAQQLAENEAKIVEELNAAQCASIDIGGYYQPNFDKASAAMRPSATFNAAIASIS